LISFKMHDTRSAVTRLRAAGLRATGSRVAILAELEQNRTHPNAADLYERLSGAHPSLSVSTVYLTLETFERAGLLRRLTPKDGKVRVDGTTEFHDHAVCRDCGDVFDVPPASRALAPPEGLPPGLRVLGTRIEYDVLCTSCQRKRQDAC
jgi:Fur family transcriptional regulator, peroxide stress response regulator